MRDGRNGNLYLRFTGKKGQPNEFLISDPKIEKWLEQAKADAEFERDNGNCIQCDAKLHNGHCNCEQRGQ